eukprot:1099242-Rhodomonas_salina.3
MSGPPALILWHARAAVAARLLLGCHAGAWTNRPHPSGRPKISRASPCTRIPARRASASAAAVVSSAREEGVVCHWRRSNRGSEGYEQDDGGGAGDRSEGNWVP